MQQRTRKVLFTALIGALLLSTTGCIRSRARITTEPPQATVTWRGNLRGETPITIPFIWYWHYDFVLEKEGYETMEVDEFFRTPPWFLFPLDLFAEMLPIPIPDTRKRHYVLTPIPEV